MPGQANFLDDIANDLSLWIDRTADEVATAFAPSRAPFSANISEEQKLEYYRARLFNPDGTPNTQGRDQELARLGSDGFTRVYKAVVARYPDLKIPSPPEIAVPQEWPAVPRGRPPVPAGPAPAMPAPPGGGPPPAAGPAGPRPMPRPPMMPPAR